MNSKDDGKRVLDILDVGLEQAASALDQLRKNGEARHQISAAALLMAEAMKAGGKVISFGNGGSMCDAMHFAEELTGRFRDDRRPLAAVAISDPSHLSCVGNDYGFDHVFARYIAGVARTPDVLLAISTSGNSKNCLRALEEGRRMGLKSILLTGNPSGQLNALASVVVVTPGTSGYADRVQELHIKVIHSWIQALEILV